MTATPTTMENPVSEKAKAFFALAKELIDLCDEPNRRVIWCAVKGMVDIANSCDAMPKVERIERTESDLEREQAWADYYRDFGGE